MIEKRQIRTFLVLVSETEEFLVALRFAARRARQAKGRVALLSVVEPQEIETWGGVEQALTDEAFDKARKEMVKHEKLATELSGAEPDIFYRKGERRKALLELIETEPNISVLIMAAQTGEGAHNPLIQYLTSDKGLKKMRVPLTIVSDSCRNGDCADDEA